MSRSNNVPPLRQSGRRHPIHRAMRAVFGAGLTTMSLAACVTGPDFVVPASPPATRYTSAPLANLDGRDLQVNTGDGPPRQWWTLLGSERLDALEARALASNRTLAAARATLAASQALGAASESARYPQMDGSATAGRQKFGAAFIGPLNLPPFTYYSVGPSVSYAFDFSGGLRRSIERQHALIDHSKYELQAAEWSVCGNVALQALAAASARSLIQRQQAQIEDDETNLNLVRNAFDAGSGTRVDVLTAQSQLDSDRASQPPLRRALSNAEHQLALLIGASPADGPVPDFKLDEFLAPAQLPIVVPSQIVRRRPDILSAEAQLHADTAAIGVAAANLYPQMSITASASLQATTLGTLFDAAGAAYGLGASLTAPLFNHGALRAKERAAVESMQASLANYEQVVLRSFSQVADALEYLDQDTDLLHSEQSAVSTAAQNLALTRESYRVGNSGVLQVLEAQRQSGRANIELLRATAQRAQDVVGLLLAVGGPIPTN